MPTLKARYQNSPYGMECRLVSYHQSPDHVPTSRASRKTRKTGRKKTRAYSSPEQQQAAACTLSYEYLAQKNVPTWGLRGWGRDLKIVPTSAKWSTAEQRVVSMRQLSRDSTPGEYMCRSTKELQSTPQDSQARN